MFLKDKDLPIESRIFRIALIVGAVILLGICLYGLYSTPLAFNVAAWSMALISGLVFIKTLMNIIFDFYSKFKQ